MSLKGKFTCKVCSSVFANISDLDAHLKTEHKLTAKKYCNEYVKKNDLFDGSDLFFKNLEQYFYAEFNNKTNYNKWIRANKGQKIVGELMEKILKKYSILKSLEYAPSSFEFRTTPGFASLKEHISFFGYKIYDLFSSCGLKNRFSYFSDIKFPKETIKDVIIDTREQKPLNFQNYSFAKKIDTLNFGDYASSSSDVVIERKSLNDAISTLSGGFDRFCREMERVKEAGRYCVILVEEDINDFCGFNYLKKTRHSKASPDFIFKRARDLCRMFPENVQFVFSGGRKESSDLAVLFMSWGKKICERLDLQYLKESGVFNKLNLCG